MTSVVTACQEGQTGSIALLCVYSDVRKHRRTLQVLVDTHIVFSEARWEGAGLQAGTGSGSVDCMCQVR